MDDNFEKALEAFDKMIKALQELWENTIKPILIRIWENVVKPLLYRLKLPNKRVIHLAKYGRTRRVRNKNLKRILKAIQ